MQDFDGRRFDEVAAFLAVIEAGGFAGAARIVERDASVLSRRVGALERRLRVRLLERTTRSVVPTEAGARLATRLRAAVAAMAEAEQEATETAAVIGGTLRLALPATFGRMWIGPMLPDFLAAHPVLRVEASYAERYVDLVAEGYDLAVRIGQMPDSRLVMRTLASSRRFLCAAPTYLAARGEPLSPADLKRHNCLRFTRLASFPQWRFRREGRIEAIEVAGLFDSDDAPGLVAAALAGQGILMVSEWMVGPELAEGRLVEILPDWSIDGEGAIYLVRPSAQFASAKIRAFSEWIVARMMQPPWRAVAPTSRKQSGAVGRIGD